VWCHKLVKSLEVQQTFSFHFSLLQPDQIPECFYVGELWLAKVCPEMANHAFSEKF